MGYFHVVYIYGLLPHQPRKLGLLRPTLLSRYSYVQTIQSILPKPELRNSWRDSLAKQPLEVTLAEVAMICAGSRTMINSLICSRSKKLYGQVLPGDTTTDAMKQFVPYHKTHEALKKKHPTVPMLTEWGFSTNGLVPPKHKARLEGKHEIPTQNTHQKPNKIRFPP